MHIYTWKDISIKIKIIFIGFVIIAIFGGVIFGYIIPSIQKQLMSEKRQMIQNIVRTVVSNAEGLNKRVANGELSEKEAQQTIITQVRTLRYGDENDDYIWINDFNSIMVEHPTSPKFNGTDMSYFLDKDNTPIIKIFARIAKEEKSGFLQYKWGSKKDPNIIVPKLSYVQGFEPWQWAIGTGIYIDDVTAKIRNITLLISVIVAGVLLLSILMLYFFAHNISRSVNLVKKNILRVRDGDLTSRVDHPGRDEIGIMLTAYNDFAVKMCEVIEEVKSSSEQLSSASVELAAGADTFSKSSQTQAASTEEITATIEEITSGVESIAMETQSQLSKISDVRQRIDTLSADLSRMNDQIDGTRKLTGNMSSISRTTEESVSRMSSNMTKISNSSQEMRSIVDIINDISDKINLLSLNAAIEAARAGEAGRGFAVVADEISKLADQTAQSLKGIGNLIRENEAEINKFTGEMNEVLGMIKSITDGISSVDAMASSVNVSMDQGLASNREVLDGFNELQQRAEMIQSATREQRIAMDEMVRTVGDISSTAQSTASSSEEISGSAEELSGMAENLQAKVEFFKVR
jgi:methyl-accepting chemotaxis protein